MYYRMREQFELDQQKKQETLEFEISQDNENQVKMEEELERVREDTEERVCLSNLDHGSCWAVMCSVTKSPLFLCSVTVTFVIVTVTLLPLQLLCYRVTEHIIDDWSMGQWVMGHWSRKVTHGPL